MKQSCIFHSQRRMKNSNRDYKIQKKIFLIMMGFIFLALSLALAADIPMMLNYQGHVEYEDGVPLNTNGYFKFAIVNKEGDTTSWSNDGTSQTGDEPESAIKIPVTSGFFTVKLGDTDITNMSALPPIVFDQQNIYVRVWFSEDNITTFEQLAPDTQIVSAGFAYKAQTAEKLPGITVDSEGNVGIGTTSPDAKLHVTSDAGDGQAFIRASNFNPVPTDYWPDFDITAPYRLRNALWVGWDDSKKAWKYTRKSDNDRGVTDPGDPAAWVVNGEDTGYFDGDLDTLPPGTHMNNRYNSRMMACRCNQDDIQVKVGSFWIDKYPSQIIDVGPDYKGTTWKDDTADMTTSANKDVSPFWMAFSQKARASTGMTWFVAAQASVNAGKRLPTNAEWQASALGTERSSGNGIINGSDWSTVEDQDVSRYGVIGMAGNVWEWVADWIQAGKPWQEGDGQSAAPWPSDKGYGDDQTWNINGRAYNSSSWADGAPAALRRGSGWGAGSHGGVFALCANYAPSYWISYIGFRSVR